ncbi:MAG TPA: prephenate dehydrogenase/arogenate dehydrogenase family protein [Blastocatellia bacterium]|nr:prephenate dehydrogenase/arogenate dehydrogenase family protein [Blastocatellia bacterium]
MRFDRIAIVGLGLIGGSFALAARRAGIARKITGFDTSDAVEYALAHNLIDEVEESFYDGKESKADLVYLATPVRAILDFLQERSRQFKPGAIVTDAGSTKREIFIAARRWLTKEVHFIGGHPMAGSHRTGIEWASADLFLNAPYAVVTDGEGDLTDPNYSVALDAFLDVVRAIGSRPVLTTPARHDRLVARVSHSPQLLSTALAVAVAKKGEGRELSGTGFAEMTRLAGSSWSVWEDICRTNADEISSALDEVILEIESIRDSLAEGNFSTLARAFDQANESTRDF